MNIDELNTVTTSVETWLDFIDFSMQSDFYKNCSSRIGPEDAAAFTLLQNYIATFSPSEQKQIENDVHEFYRLAESFIRELSPYRYNKNGYNKTIRAAFIHKIKLLLNSQKDEKGKIIHREKYIFIRTIVKFCSSLNYIIFIHDKYKQYLFRVQPQYQ